MVTVQNLPGYLNAGSNGIDHSKGTVFHPFFMSQLIFYATVIAIDGVVRLLRVTTQVYWKSARCTRIYVVTTVTCSVCINVKVGKEDKWYSFVTQLTVTDYEVLQDMLRRR
jgi:hypothetical protein